MKILTISSFLQLNLHLEVQVSDVANVSIIIGVCVVIVLHVYLQIVVGTERSDIF